MAKQAMNLKSELKKKLEEFEKLRYEVQMIAIQTGKNDEEKIQKVQNMYIELLNDEDCKKFLEAETKFNTIIADVNKIIGDIIKDLM